jgi:hypothetical protein
LAAILALALPWALYAQEQEEAAAPAPAPLGAFVARPARFESKPVIDGRLDDPVWQTAAQLGGFRQLEPLEGQPATEPTEVYLGFTQSGLYIGVRCHDSEPGKIVSTTLTRDSDMTYDDTIQILFDTFRDGRSAYLFLTNPGGVQVDGLVRNEGEQVSLDWDAAWDVQSTRDDGGWSTEIEIPWRSLRFPEKPQQEWGFSIERQVARKQERTFWKAPKRSWYARWKLSEAGTLVGLEGARPGSRFHFSPYVVGGGEQPADHESTSSITEIGGDLKINLTSNLVADLTIKTDFSETEADQQEVNLSRNPLFFPEKRGFFLEGASNFYAGQRPDPEHPSRYYLFFSRRIGLSEDGRATIPILGGVKLTGRQGKYDLGVLGLQTEDTRKPDGYGGLIIAPRTSYSVARVKRDLGNGSSLGIIGLSKESTGDHNRVGGTDWDITLNENLRTGGYFAKSSTPGISGNDWAGSADIYWDSRHWRFLSEYTEIGEGFNDELGFISRTGVRSFRSDNYYILWPERGPFKQAWLVYDLDYIADRTTGEVQTRINNFKASAYFRNSSGFAYKYYDQMEVLSEPFEIHRGVIIPPGSYRFGHHFFGFQTDYTKPLGAAGRVAWGEYYDGHYTQTFYYFAYRPVPGLILDATYQHTQVSLTAGRFDSDIVLGEVIYAFTNRIAVRAWWQWTKEANARTKIDLSWELRNGTKLFFVYQDIESYIDFFNPRQPLFGIPGRTLTFKTVLAL